MRITLFGGASIPFFSDCALGWSVLTIKVEVTEKTLPERIAGPGCPQQPFCAGNAGLGCRQQPFEREIGVTRNAQAFDETAANLRLGAGVASVCVVHPNGKGGIPILGCRCNIGDAHRVGRVGEAGRRRRSWRCASFAHAIRPGGSRRSFSPLSWARKPGSSSRQRRSKTSAPASIWPMTG